MRLCVYTCMGGVSLFEYYCEIYTKSAFKQHNMYTKP